MLNTWIEPEERCYPSGGLLRRARVELRANPHNPIELPYGETRMVRAGIPDTFFTVPAVYRAAQRLTLNGARHRIGKYVRGYISTPHDGAKGRLYFTPEADPERCKVCAEGEGCRRA